MAAVATAHSTTRGKRPTLGTAGLHTIKEVAKDGQNVKLESLTQQVEAMAGVFGEANNARQAHRKMMEERHQDVLRKVQAVRTYCDQESLRLDRQVCSFRDKFEHDLERLTNDMLQKLDTKVTAINARIDDQEERVGVLEQGLAKEKEDRIRQTEQILGFIKKQVDNLTDGLAKETKIRQTREQEITKRIVACKEEIDATIDREKFKREQICQRITNDADSENKKLSKRQEGHAKQTNAALLTRQAAIEYETATRVECQDSVVDNVSSFIQRFQDNIRAEGDAGT